MNATSRPMRTVLLLGAALAILGLVAAPAIAKCPRDCKREIKTGFRNCERVCPKGKAGATCRNTCKLLRRAAAGACIKASVANDPRPASPTAPACGSDDIPFCSPPGLPCGPSPFGVVLCCTKPDMLACEDGVCCVPAGAACLSDDECCNGLECSGELPGTCVAISTTTTSTTATTTTTGTGNPACTGYANPAPTFGSNAFFVYGSCTTAISATSFGAVFGTPLAPLGGFTASGNDICQISSASPGTNNYYSCTAGKGGGIVFPAGGTRPCGYVQAFASPGGAFSFTFYVDGRAYPGIGSGGG